MKTVDLKKEHPSIDTILSMARFDSIMIQGADGAQYILEEADEFEKEVKALGESEKFNSFLQERSKEKGGKSLDEISGKLEDAEMQ